MIGLSLPLQIILFWNFFIHLEALFFLTYTKNIKLNVKTTLRTFTTKTELAAPQTSILTYFFLYLVILISLKDINSSFVLQAFFFFWLILSLFAYFYNYSIQLFNYSNPNTRAILSLVIHWLLFSFFFLAFCTNFILLLFILELISVIYYFFFLTCLTPAKEFHKYKTIIYLYLWNSFFTTIIYVLGLCFLFIDYGTTAFSELFLLNLETTSYGYVFICLSLIFKVGFPGLHFFKVEIYRHLRFETLFFYSLVTIFLNLFLFLFLLIQIFTQITLQASNWLILFLALNCSVIINFFPLSTLYHFFAYSGLVTLFTLFTFWFI